MRYAVWQRDRGKCSRCGRDCETWPRRLERLAFAYRSRHFHSGGWTDAMKERFLNLWRRAACGVYPVPEARKIGWATMPTWWEAHHKHACKDGGGACGLDNVETLCVLCHHAETAAQRRRHLPAPPPDTQLKMEVEG